MKVCTMKAIILAAGQGSRLGRICQDKPKCLMAIEDNTLLEIQINTLHACGIEDISVVRGYQGDKIDIPGLSYYDNDDFADTNVLHSVFCAHEALDDEVLIMYSDILYEQQVVKRLMESSQDISVGVMVNWQESIRQRDEVALEDLEMVYFDSENLIREVGKNLTKEYETQGQFVGMVKCSQLGTEILKKNYDRVKKHYSGKSFWHADVFEKALLSDLFQEMTDLGVPLHCVIIERGWMEIDTPEDYERALTDTQFVRRMVQKKTDWTARSKLYNNLDWVNRDELLNTIVETAGDLADSKVLDLGTGTGKILIALNERNPQASYYGVDISQSMLDKIEPADAFDLSIRQLEDLHGFKDNDFDLLTARMVFHHVNDLDKAMKEVYRVLKPGGRFIVCEGNPPDSNTVGFYKEMFRFKEDRNTFLLDDLVNMLTRNGFENVTSRTVITKNMSLNNWLDKSGLPFRNIDIIKKMHYECSPGVQKAYDMKFTEDDILMEWKFSVVYGEK